jgi:DnaJ-class molecular chaperone
MRIKIKIEIDCDECGGSGRVNVEPYSEEQKIKTMLCSECDGVGYEEKLISIQDLKDLLSGGDK